MNSLNRNRLQSSDNNNNIILVVMAIFSLSIIGSITTVAFSPFDRIQIAAAQQENNNNNTKLLSLSTISTAIGTGAAATGAIVTVPGFLRGRKQSKFLGTYLLKIHMTNFVKQQNLQTKIKMNIWTFWMLCVVILYTCCKRET
jgi:hypothetical protein